MRAQSKGIQILFLLVLGVASRSALPSEHRRATPEVARTAFLMSVQGVEAALPVEASMALDREHPEIERLVVVFHGKGGDVEGYYRALKSAASAAGTAGKRTVVVAPQFLREEDTEALNLPGKYFRWNGGSWSAGLPAAGPVPISSFAVIDALVRTWTDRAFFPNLKDVVLVGHSGGGQLLNRYAIVGTMAARLEEAGMRVRYVIANPSSYLYFSDERPQNDGTFAAYVGTQCPGFNHWRYGVAHAPPYVDDDSAAAWAARESSYARRDVIYLLGTNDIDPEQADLDTSCAAELEGPERLDRGKAYYQYLRLRHAADLKHQLWFVRGVSHSGGKMIESDCAVAAIFDHGTCKDRVP